MKMYLSKVQVKLNLLENLAFENLWKKDKGWSLQRVVLERALKFEILDRFTKNKKNLYKIFIGHVCIPMQKISVDLKIQFFYHLFAVDFQ